MAYRIEKGCSACGMCIEECPVGCIADGREACKIDEARCTDCGACAAVCPLKVATKAATGA